jgi:hypothetical protein
VNFRCRGGFSRLLVAVVNYHRTGDLGLWPVYIAYMALTFFAAGLLFNGVRALLWSR